MQALLQIIENYCLMLHSKEWVANHDGNISLRMEDGNFLAVASGISKRLVSAHDSKTWVIIDKDGKRVAGDGKPFSEFALHLAAYKARSEIFCVIHAHPPIASSFSLARIEPYPIAMPEVVVSLGSRIPLTNFAMPKTRESEEEIFRLSSEYDSMLIAANGVLTVGVNAEQAFLRMELVEHYCKIFLEARKLGGVIPLSSELMQTLLEERKKAGLRVKETVKETKFIESNSNSFSKETIKEIIKDELLKTLRK